MKNKKSYRRTLRVSVDLETMREVTSDDLLLLDEEALHQIRHTVRSNWTENTPRYVCGKCGYPVYLSRQKSHGYWAHRKGAPTNCPWWKGDPGDVDDISAKQYDGKQESPLHYRLKHIVAGLLRGDPNAANVEIEKRINHQGNYRKPDISSVYAGRSFAIEIQLATTQVPIIMEREEFYTVAGIELVWLTWQFSEEPFDKVRQAFKDIYFRHNKNIFSITPETIKQSKQLTRFSFLAHVSVVRTFVSG